MCIRDRWSPVSSAPTLSPRAPTPHPTGAGLLEQSPSRPKNASVGVAYSSHPSGNGKPEAVQTRAPAQSGKYGVAVAYTKRRPSECHLMQVGAIMSGPPWRVDLRTTQE